MVHQLINIYEKNNNKISLNNKIIKLSKSILKELEKDNPDVKIIDNISLKIVEYSKNNNYNKKNLFIEEKGEELIIRKQLKTMKKTISTIILIIFAIIIIPFSLYSVTNTGFEAYKNHGLTGIIIYFLAFFVLFLIFRLLNWCLDNLK
jgi:hypothetical protein